MTNWLTDIVVVNESRDEGSAGDVTVFRSAGEACRYLEHWWVQNGEGFAFTAVGERLMLDLDAKDRVIVTGKQDVPEGAEIVREWLQSCAVSVLNALKAKAGRGKGMLSPTEEREQLPTSVEGLIAYVGFSD